MGGRQPLSTPYTFNWAAGAQHTIAAGSTETVGSGTQLTFSNWSDGGGVSHTITAAAGVTYTANFSAQYLLATAASPSLGGSISPASGWYNSGQIVQVSESPSAGYSFTGFSGDLTGTSNPASVTMNGPVSVLANFSSGTAMYTIAATASVPTFSVDSHPCVIGTYGTYGTCTFPPQPQGDTLAATQMAPPAGGSVPRYEFSAAGVIIAPQEIALPPTGPGGGDCPCSNGVCSVRIPIGSPSSPPVIQPPLGGTYGVSLDQAGQIPAVLVPGVQTTIYINGTNFGNVAGIASLCTAGGTPCTFYANLQISEFVQSWSNTQIVDLVTMDPQTPPGPWEVFLTVPFWIPAGYGMNPSMGSFEVEEVPTTVTITTRQSLTQFTAAGSPQGGTFSYGATFLSGNPSVYVEPQVQLATGESAQANPSVAALSNPTNPCVNQVPCAGNLAGIVADYQTPAANQFVLPESATAQLNVALFGLSCYDTITQQQWGTAPNACLSTTINVNGSPVTYSGAAPTSPPGLPNGNYCNAFLAQLQLNGSASLADGTLVQYDPTSGYTVVSAITAADGTPVQAGQTIARDRSIIPKGGVRVDINGVGTGLLANDIGNRIQGYRIDVYMGAGPGACNGTVPNSNIMAISGCNPGNFTCPSSSAVGQ